MQKLDPIEYIKLWLGFSKNNKEGRLIKFILHGIEIYL